MQFFHKKAIKNLSKPYAPVLCSVIRLQQ